VRLRSERILTPAGVSAGEVVIAGDVIEAVAPSRGTGEDAHWIVPGYIDLHVHGGGGAQFNTDDPDEIAAAAGFHASHGTTALLATLVSAPIEELTRAMRAIKPQGTIIGTHLEGPFLSRERHGALDPDTFLEPDREVALRLLEAQTVKLMTLAPELPGAPALITTLRRHGVVASIGHSDASYEQAAEAVELGASAVTHLFNAMRPWHHRDPGVIGAALDLPGVSCELICDGFHVDPAALRLAYRAKGVDELRLITDATAAAGMPDGVYRLGAAEIHVRDGRVLAGTTLTMAEAVRNAVTLMGIGIEQAVAMASVNPARLLGIDDRKGQLAPGFDADLVLLDADLRPSGTLAGGNWIESARSKQ
jgi:N-acetylglucosamine-6-phosphate deacetylase